MRIVALLALIVLGACRKESPPSSQERPEASLPMPRSSGGARTPTPSSAATPALDDATRQAMRELDAVGAAEAELAESRRREMVTPAPAGFKPEAVARKVRLVIGLEKTRVRAGQLPRFSLTMTNVGREPIEYRETQASLFVRGGSLNSTWVMHMYVTDSRGRRTELTPSSRPRRIGPTVKPVIPSGLSPAEMERWFVSTNAREEARAHFRIRLLPGETLHSVGDDDPPGDFKALETDDDFDVPGRYRLTLELDDRPKPPSQLSIELLSKRGETLDEIKRVHELLSREAVGPVSSNAVEFEVVK